jgi:hypothetical protein
MKFLVEIEIPDKEFKEAKEQHDKFYNQNGDYSFMLFIRNRIKSELGQILLIPLAMGIKISSVKKK